MAYVTCVDQEIGGRISMVQVSDDGGAERYLRNVYVPAEVAGTAVGPSQVNQLGPSTFELVWASLPGSPSVIVSASEY